MSREIRHGLLFLTGATLVACSDRDPTSITSIDAVADQTAEAEQPLQQVPLCEGRAATIYQMDDGTWVLPPGASADFVNGMWHVVGTTGDDVIVGTDGDDHIVARGGNDVACGGSGDDIFELGTGDDRAYGEDGNDTMFGGGGVDRVDGGDGDDTLWGGNDVDELFGGNGDDQLNAGSPISPPVPGDFANGGPDNDACEADIEVNCET